MYNMTYSERRKLHEFNYVMYTENIVVIRVCTLHGIYKCTYYSLNINIL